MATRVIGFAGSPRVGGNSDLLLDEVLAGATESGATVEKVRLNKLTIKPCQGCDSCQKPARKGEGCVNIDDMQELYGKLLEADVWVLATPVYWWGPSAQLKLMVDRWYGLPGRHDKLAGKRAALVVAMGDEEPKTAHPTIEMFTDAFEYLKMKFFEPVVAVAHDKGEVKKDQAALRKARELGRKIAS
ncbi:MAG TPA: flavodoxin family protein [Bacillota bacterium]|jgi:multimeric flavodoxin WrbA